ncbi:phosphoadenosine phosphosulfate reductase [Streptomyces sp. DH10]|uniref:phosphoadenosine phosphosulfate reductase n=1 Tax=Streptomyces sp. DH10 TaxID=3040121 RepID=UPI00244195B6|nr:phosphoadenosine phosphosulfate reductase [Streptomyces sp. DH10]MDG9709753.1 phosphoadenosine phosphosulfate reductase [Streptomyces sp. DH10]
MSHPTPLYSDPVEFAATRHRIVINLSGGKDGLVAGLIAMDAARQAGVADRVWTAHASLGPMEWPAVTVDGVRWPSASELAAQHSQALGVPPERHIEVRRSREVDGERVPFDLLTFIAERGDWPWLGRARTCTGPWKTKMVYQAFTPQVRALRKETGGPLMFANVLGMRAEESRERRNREMWRRTTDNSARVVDEWLPAHQVTTEEVWERTISAGLPYHWCYDSYPGAKDRCGSSRCSCSACTLANHRDLLLTAGRRPRLAELCALVERVRQVPFNPNITMAEIIALSRRRDAPAPGVEVEETEDFERMERDVHAALRKPPTWDSKARTGPGELLHSAAGCDGCS